jgi:hypothetical protein
MLPALVTAKVPVTALATVSVPGSALVPVLPVLPSL